MVVPLKIHGMATEFLGKTTDQEPANQHSL